MPQSPLGGPQVGTTIETVNEYSQENDDEENDPEDLDEQQTLIEKYFENDAK